MTATRPRVLHLAYEDPQAPGSGGGSVRTREINDRLGEHFAIDVVSATFAGSRAYTANGVRYAQLGLENESHAAAERDRLKAREAGFDAHLTKPADPTALQGLLAQNAQPA